MAEARQLTPIEEAKLSEPMARRRERLRKLRLRAQRLRFLRMQQQRQNIISDIRSAGGSEAEVEKFEKQRGPISEFDPSVSRKVVRTQAGEERIVHEPSPSAKRATAEFIGTALPGGLPLGLIRRSVFSGIGGGLSSLLSESFDPSEKPGERAAITGGLGFLSEFVPGAVGKGLFGKSSTMKPGAAAVNRARIARGDRPLLPAQSTTNAATDLLQTGGASSLFFSGVVRRAEEEVKETALKGFDDFLEAFGPGGREASGDLITSAINKTHEVKSAAESFAAKQLDDVAPLQREIVKTPDGLGGFNEDLRRVGGGVDIGPAQDFARKLLDPEHGGVPAGIKSELNQLIERPQFISFDEAWKRAQKYGKAGRLATELFSGESKGAAKQLFKRINKGIDKAGKELNPAALEKWKRFKAMVKLNREEINSKVIRRLVGKATPEDVYSGAVKTASTSSVNTIRNIITKTKGGTEKWKNIQGQWLTDIAASAQHADNHVSGAAFRNAINKQGADGKLEALFPDVRTRKLVERWADELPLSQSAPDSGAYGMAFRMGQMGAMGSFFVKELQGFEAAKVAMILTPAALAHVITNPLAHKIMVEGFQSIPGSRQAIVALTKLATTLKNNGFHVNIDFTGAEDEIGSP